MLFSDNQTKHFYVLKSTDTVSVKDLEDSNLFRVIGTDSNSKAIFTSDVIDRKLIKKIKINEVKPTYFRKWTVNALSAVTAGTTYYVYFYLENMMGFGMQDRWDRVASYTATDTTVATVMQHLAVDLWGKLNAAGPIKDDFTVSYGGTPVTKAMFENGTLPTAVSGTDIVVAENPASETFELTELDLRTHTNPYAYHVTMSTGMTTDNGIEAWSDAQKEITADNDTDNVYIKSATKVLDMELYFLRNRGDLYDLTKDFGTSILNKPRTEDSKGLYYTLDIDYAFSDTQGYTYHSDKQLSIACATKATLATLKTAIMTDSNETAWAVADGAEYTNRTGDTD